MIINKCKPLQLEMFKSVADNLQACVEKEKNVTKHNLDGRRLGQLGKRRLPNFVYRVPVPVKKPPWDKIVEGSASRDDANFVLHLATHNVAEDPGRSICNDESRLFSCGNESLVSFQNSRCTALDSFSSTTKLPAIEIGSSIILVPSDAAKSKVDDSESKLPPLSLNWSADGGAAHSCAGKWRQHQHVSAQAGHLSSGNGDFKDAVLGRADFAISLPGAVGAATVGGGAGGSGTGGGAGGSGAGGGAATTSFATADVHVGFQTGCGKAISVSKKALMKSSILLEDVENQGLSTLTTASERKLSAHVSVGAEASSTNVSHKTTQIQCPQNDRNASARIYDNATEATCHDLPFRAPTKSDASTLGPVGWDPGTNPAHLQTMGFSTGHGKAIKITEDALERSRRCLAEQLGSSDPGCKERTGILYCSDRLTRAHTEDVEERACDQEEDEESLWTQPSQGVSDDKLCAALEAHELLTELAVSLLLKLSKSSSSPRTQLVNLPVRPAMYSISKICQFDVDPAVCQVTCRNAEDFSFQDFLGKSPPHNGIAGWKQFSSVLMRMDSICSPALTEDWVHNHYRWIVWKLASYEMRMPLLFGGCALTPMEVMRQLLVRYKIEMETAGRSFVKKVCEGDESTSRCVVLLVTDLSRLSQKQLMLSDGWYGIVGLLDEGLSLLVERGRLRVGDKIITYGAELVGQREAMPPLECFGKKMLKLSVNATRRAHWATKLGLCRSALPKPLALSSLRCLPGLVSCIQGIIIRIYPTQFVERLPDGSMIWRSERSEQLAEQAFERMKEQQFEREIKASSDNRTEKDENQGKSVTMQHWTSKEITGMTSGSDLSIALRSSFDPDSIVESMTVEQKKVLTDHFEWERCDRQTFQRRPSQHAEERRRDVSNVVKLRVAGSLIPDFDSHKHAILAVWRLSPDLHLQEGQHYKLYNLQSSASKSKLGFPDISLSSRKQTVFHLLPNCPLVRYIFSPRQVTPLKALKEKHPPLHIDIVCVVEKVVPLDNDLGINRFKESNCQSVHILDQEDFSANVNFYPSLQDLNLDHIVKAGATVAFSDLLVLGPNCKGVEELRFLPASAVSLNPRLPHLHKFLTEWKQSMLRQTNWSTSSAIPKNQIESNRLVSFCPQQTSTPKEEPLRRAPLCRRDPNIMGMKEKVKFNVRMGVEQLKEEVNESDILEALYNKKFPKVCKDQMKSRTPLGSLSASKPKEQHSVSTVPCKIFSKLPAPHSTLTKSLLSCPTVIAAANNIPCKSSMLNASTSAINCKVDEEELNEDNEIFENMQLTQLCRVKCTQEELAAVEGSSNIPVGGLAKGDCQGRGTSDSEPSRANEHSLYGDLYSTCLALKQVEETVEVDRDSNESGSSDLGKETDMKDLTQFFNESMEELASLDKLQSPSRALKGENRQQMNMSQDEVCKSYPGLSQWISEPLEFNANSEDGDTSNFMKRHEKSSPHTKPGQMSLISQLRVRMQLESLSQKCSRQPTTATKDSLSDRLQNVVGEVQRLNEQHLEDQKLLTQSLLEEMAEVTQRGSMVIEGLSHEHRLRLQQLPSHAAPVNCGFSQRSSQVLSSDCLPPSSCHLCADDEPIRQLLDTCFTDTGELTMPPDCSFYQICHRLPATSPATRPSDTLPNMADSPSSLLYHSDTDTSPIDGDAPMLVSPSDHWTIREYKGAADWSTCYREWNAPWHPGKIDNESGKIECGRLEFGKIDNNENGVEVNSIECGKVDGITIESGKIDGNTIECGKIDDDTIDYEKIDGDTIECGKVDGITNESGKIDGDTIECEKVDGITNESGKIDGDTIECGKLDGDPIECGKIGGRTIECGKTGGDTGPSPVMKCKRSRISRETIDYDLLFASSTKRRTRSQKEF